jgi:hypothetical protein
MEKSESIDNTIVDNSIDNLKLGVVSMKENSTDGLQKIKNKLSLKVKIPGGEKVVSDKAASREESIVKVNIC